MVHPTTWRDHGIWRWRRHAVPIGVWLAAVAAAGHLFVHRSTVCELTGIARPEQREIAALTDGRLRLVPVDLLEPVKEGQTLAVLEDDLIQASLATAAAEASRLRAELAAMENRLTFETATQKADQMAQARQYAIDIEDGRLREIELQVIVKTDRIKLEFLQLQKDLLKNLRGQRAVSELRFQSAEADYQALNKSIEENQNLLSQIQQDLQQARRRQERFAQNQVQPLEIDKAIEPIRAAVTVQEKRIGELAMERSMLVLKSPMDGVVSQHWRGVGESVQAGEPILTVVARRPSAVIAYATAAQVARLDEGTPVRLEVARENAIRLCAGSQVQAVGPVAEELPVQLRRNPNVPEWGWPIKIAVPSELGIYCGEIIGVSQP